MTVVFFVKNGQLRILKFVVLWFVVGQFLLFFLYITLFFFSLFVSKQIQMKIPNLIKSIFFGIPIGVTIVDSVGYVARVDGISMQPALNPDRNTTDYVFLNRLAVKSYEVKRGDIVSLISPKDPSQKIIKRVVGVQGK